MSPQEHRGVGDLLWSRRQIFSRFLAFFKLVSDRDASASTVQREVVDETGGEAVDKAVGETRGSYLKIDRRRVAMRELFFP